MRKSSFGHHRLASQKEAYEATKRRPMNRARPLLQRRPANKKAPRRTRGSTTVLPLNISIYAPPHLAAVRVFCLPHPGYSQRVCRQSG